MTAAISSTRTRPIRIGARRSPLAVAQADWVAEQLRAAGHRVEIVGIVSQGDVDGRKLTEIGGTGVFAAAVREALLDGSIDVAVHSLKDLPVAPVPGLGLTAVPLREDPREVIVGVAPDQWTDQTVIGTGSPRRELQLAALAAARGVGPTFVAVRGNVDTRINLVRSGQVHATVLAAAGLRRLGRLTDADPTRVAGVPATILHLDQVLPAAGQAALAVETRTDAWCRDDVAALQHADTRAAVDAERRFLATLEAGCLAPVGAYASVSETAPGVRELTLTVATARNVPDAEVLSDSATGPADEAEALGDALARRVLQALQTTSSDERVTQ